MAHVRCPRELRFTLLATALAASACIGSPAVLRSMTSLPDDHEKQHEQNASALARPGDRADIRKPLTGKLKGVETAAASVAALIGMFYSTSPNVLMGAETRFEEMLLFDPNLSQRPHGGSEKGDDKDKAAPPVIDSGQLVPWIHLPPPRSK